MENHTKLLEWKQNHRESALVVKGAIQSVRPTHDRIRKYEPQNVSIHQPRGRTAKKRDFRGEVTAETLHERLPYDYPGILSKDHALMLDEVELCPRAMYALKPLAQEGRFDVMASGPLLRTGTRDDVLSPMGYTGTIVMEPIDLHEGLGSTRVPHDFQHSVRSCLQGPVRGIGQLMRTQ